MAVLVLLVGVLDILEYRLKLGTPCVWFHLILLIFFLCGFLNLFTSGFSITFILRMITLLEVVLLLRVNVTFSLPSALSPSPDGLFCLCSVYSGHQSILIPPSELETNPALWLLAVSQYKVRDTFCSYSVMELCTKGLGSQTESLKVSSPQATLVLRKDTHTLGEASTKSWMKCDLLANWFGGKWSFRFSPWIAYHCHRTVVCTKFLHQCSRHAKFFSVLIWY